MRGKNEKKKMKYKWAINIEKTNGASRRTDLTPGDDAARMISEYDGQNGRTVIWILCACLFFETREPVGRVDGKMAMCLSAGRTRKDREV